MSHDCRYHVRVVPSSLEIGMNELERFRVGVASEGLEKGHTYRAFDFRRIVPTPAEIPWPMEGQNLSRPLLDWCWENWGSLNTWDSRLLYRPTEFSEPDMLWYEFIVGRTYEPVMKVIHALVGQYPLLDILINVSSEGEAFYYIEGHAGKVITAFKYSKDDYSRDWFVDRPIAPQKIEPIL